jgi:hypothetical protein
MVKPLLIAIVLLAPLGVSAHVPKLIETPGQHDVLLLEEPEVSQVLYGELEGYPHMYEFYTKEPIELFVEVLVPDISFARKNVSGLILRVNDNGSVTEVARLSAKNAPWESFYEWWGGDTYLRGVSYEGEIERGMYRVEVSTPDNIGKYALAVGREESFAGVGYFELLGRLIEVKQFFGKSAFSVLQSPIASVPLAILLCAAVFLGRFLLRRAKA